MRTVSKVAASKGVQIFRTTVLIKTTGQDRARELGHIALTLGSIIAITALIVGGGAIGAAAAPGDISHAEGQFLSGSLLDLNATLVASLGGETATSDGTTSQTNANNLNLGALGIVAINIPGGIQVPLDLTSAGVISQYASALNDGSSIGASGLVAANGDIGTGVTPAPGAAPGPLSLNLAQVVGSLGLPAGTVAELANLDLTLGLISGRAAQAAPAVATGSYEITAGQLSFDSATAAAFVTDINAQVAALQATIGALNVNLTAGLDVTLAGLGVTTTTLAVSTPGLAAVVAGVIPATLTDPVTGVTIDLASGAITVDLDALGGGLNGRPANTQILTVADIAAVNASILGLLTTLTTAVETAVQAAIDAITIVGSTTVLGVDVFTVNTTVGALRVGDTTGLALVGTGLGLPGGLPVVLAALQAPLTTLTTSVNALSDTVLAPVNVSLLPALTTVLDDVLTIFVNNQTTVAGQFAETALRVTVLPTTAPLVLNVGTGRVGANALLAAPVATTLIPDNGPETGGTAVTISGAGFTTASDVTIDGVSVPFVVVDDATITFTTPAHVPATVPVVVTTLAGISGPLGFTFTPVMMVISVDPPSGPEAGANTVTITGQCFTGATSVLFGSTPASSFTVVSDTRITAVVPAGLGIVDVTVVGAGTCGTGILPDGYQYLPVPAALALDPVNGPDTGGTVVTITGAGFTGVTGVTFDGAPGTGLVVVSDTELQVASPAHAAGPVDVIVTSPGGASAPLMFTYFLTIRLLAVDPGTGLTTGATTVTITGRCFTGATSVLFGSTPASSFTVVSDTRITAVVPAGLGVVDVTVVGAGTCGTAIALNAFRDTSSTPAGTGSNGNLAGTGFNGNLAGIFGILALLISGAGVLMVRRGRFAS